MESPLRQPQQILAYRSLQWIRAKPRNLWAVGLVGGALTALQMMADKRTAHEQR
jgi:hypothetical protein